MANNSKSVNIDTNDNDKWTCKHCHKTYSKNYKYKVHLTKCLVHQERCNMEQEMLTELRNEFKTQLSKLLDEIRNDFKENVKPNSYISNQHTQKRPLLNLF